MEHTMKLRKSNRTKTNNRVATTSVKPKTKSKSRKSQKFKKCICLPSTADHADFPLVWSELRNNMQLCDGVVKCEDNREFKVHRAILSAVSPFFKALFLNTLHKGEPEETEVYIKVPGKIFCLILDYAYSGKCAVTNENVQCLLAYADQLEVLGCVQMCCQYIVSNLDPSNCLEVLLFARHYFCKDLEEKGTRFIRHHFLEVMKSNPDFFNLTDDELYDILSDDELNAKSEEIVFEAIQKWVEHDPQKRKQSLGKLLSAVRLGLLACNFYTTKVLKWKLLLENDECQDILHKATLYLSARNFDQYAFGDLRDIIRSRVPYEILFTVGGWSAGSPTSFVETYDCRADRWLLCVNTDVTPRAYHGICTLDGLIYMIGGFDGTEHFNTMRSFNPVTREWREHACMYYPRCYVSVATYDGKIYAMGGYNGRTRMNSAERYDPETNQWELIASMQRQRSDASAAVLQDKIYIAGGFNGTEVLRSVEVYDPLINQWSIVTSMTEARSGVSVVAFKDSIYAFGGFNGYSRLNTAEKYLVEQEEWREIAIMLNPRSNFATVVLDHLIYVVGGFNGESADGNTTISNVECYDAVKNEWFPVSSMNLNRSALSACVLSGLPNAKEYSYTDKNYHYMNAGMSDAIPPHLPPTDVNTTESS